MRTPPVGYRALRLLVRFGADLYVSRFVLPMIVALVVKMMLVAELMVKVKTVAPMMFSVVAMTLSSQGR